MRFIPHTEEERQEMLRVIGVERIEDLFADVPEAYRFPPLNLPPPLTELEARWELEALAEANTHAGQYACFLGAGAYRHFIPAVVDELLRRGEFYTAYTPYQPEVSQGTLQAMFEFQSMICALTGMEVANASHYDGSSALAEAVLMALRLTRGERPRILLFPTIHPEYRAVVRTYVQHLDVRLEGDEGWTREQLREPLAVLEALEARLDGETAALVIPYPDFLGRVLPPARLRETADRVHRAGALLIAVINPIALALFEPPGSWGADIVVGEGQPWGSP
jgi:glycine dehydrogenase subunit 1